ncbi:hypothetical protein, partial [uncultured Xanthomonas sp.]|uniref:hypothetical protein n=1 Tax=uncultured Xanthomonas sp. TaxID=152831 RepID=UPI0025D02C37
MAARSSGDEYEYYDAKGRLLEVRNRNGRRQFIAYLSDDAKDPGYRWPVQVLDQSGRGLVFSYGASGRISSISQTNGSSVSYAYDADGNMAAATYSDGSKKTYVYAERDNMDGFFDVSTLTGIIDEDGGRFATYAYQDRFPVSTSHAGVEKHTVAYQARPDSVGDVDVVSPLGMTERHRIERINGAYKATKVVGSFEGVAFERSRQFDTQARVIEKKDAIGNVTKYTYGSNDLLSDVAISDGGGNVVSKTSFKWDADLLVPVERKRFNANNLAETLSYGYNNRGQVQAISRTGVGTKNKRAVAISYCEQSDVDAGRCPFLGLLTSMDGPRTDVNDISSYSYYLSDDSACASSPINCTHRKGDLWKVTNALSQVTEYLAYDGAGRVLSVKDANGVVTDYMYHSRGWLTASKVRGADDSSESDDRITAIDYWPTGLVKQVTQPDGAFTRFTYDAAHRLTDIADNAGNTIHYTLDNAGNRLKEDTQDAAGTLKRTLSRVYNQLGQLATQATAQGDPTDFSYDAAGNTAVITDVLGSKNQTDYDPLKRLARTLQDVGGIAAETKFGYDALDNLTKVTDPKGLDTTYAYNGLGDLTKLTSPDTGSTTYTYDSAGNRATQTDARNIKTSYGYDALNRLTQVTYPTTSLNVSYTYDVSQSTCASGETYALGRLTRMQDGSGSTDYCYDRFGDLVRKVQTTNGKVFVVRYAYTKAGQLSRLTYPDGAVVDYVRNAQGQTTEVGVTPPGGTRQVLLNQATYYPFGPVAGWTYGNGRPMQRVLDQDYRPLAVNDTRSDGLAVGFAFDPVGNLSALTAPGNTAPVIKLDYDPLGRLTAFKDGPTDTVIDGYTYDATGNRLSAKVNTTTQTYSYPTTSHRLSSVAGTARSYDAAGNTTAIGGTAVQYIYGANGRLTQVKRSGTTVANYAYNGRGEQVRRVGKTNVYTLYDESGHWLGDYDNNGAVVQQAIWLDDLPVGVLAKTTLRYVQPDHLGTPRAVIDPVRDVAIWRWDL